MTENTFGKPIIIDMADIKEIKCSCCNRKIVGYRMATIKDIGTSKTLGFLQHGLGGLLLSFSEPTPISKLEQAVNVLMTLRVPTIRWGTGKRYIFQCSHCGIRWEKELQLSFSYKNKYKERWT